MTDVMLLVNIFSRAVVVGVIAYVVYRRVHCGTACSRLGVAATGWFGWLTGLVGVLGVVAPAFGAAMAIVLSLYLVEWGYEPTRTISDKDHKTVSTSPDGGRPRGGGVS